MEENEIPQAFVLFNVESGSEDQALKAAKDIGWVQKAPSRFQLTILKSFAYGEPFALFLLQ